MIFKKLSGLRDKINLDDLKREAALRALIYKKEMKKISIFSSLILLAVFSGCSTDGDQSSNTGSATKKVVFLNCASLPEKDQIPAPEKGANCIKDLDDVDKKPIIPKTNPAPVKELIVEDIVEGTGPSVKAGDVVTVDYVGAIFGSGKEFDSSWERGIPFETVIGQGQVIAGWDEGIVGMKAGGRRELIIPPELGYGEMGSPPSIPGNSTLVFIVDLKKIK